MSQNRTIILGLEPAETKTGSNPSGANPSFYSRGNNRSAAHGTVVPGMEEGATAAAPSSDTAAAQQPRRNVQPGRPIVGFLFSISRTPMGEFWPIQMGRNTIGQSEECDIMLAEGTISSNHAVIVTRQVKGGVIAAITDAQSTNGTMINGETIGFSAEECHNGDIITIGSNYEFVLILIDAGKLGLSVSKDFIAVESNEEEDFEDVPTFSTGSTRPGGFDPYNDGPATWGNGGGYAPAGGTVGMDGSVSGNNHGGTIPM